MKKFIYSFVIFIVLGFILLSIYANIILSFPNEILKKFSWFGVYKIILKSEKKVENDTIYFGDSVGNSILPPHLLDNSFTTNGAVTIIGHYILANRLIERNENIKTIIVVGIPMRIGNGLSINRTYGYFVKPFLTFSNLKYFDSSVIKQLLKFPMSFLSILKATKILPHNDIDFSKNHTQENKLSDISIIYFKKLKKLCNDNNITLKLVSPPLREKYKKQFSNWAEYKKQIKENGLEEIFGNYFNNIVYINDSCFNDDWHYKRAYLQTNNNRAVLRKMTLNQIQPKQINGNY